MKHLLDYITIHEHNPRYGSGPSQRDLDLMAAELRGMNPKSVIDWGCGNSQALNRLFPNATTLRRYDPAIPGLDMMPRGRYDLGICTDVMEHIPHEEIDDTLQKHALTAPDWLYIIHMFPANQKLPDGSNAHVSQHNAEWWRRRIGQHFDQVNAWPCDSLRCFVRARLCQ